MTPHLDPALLLDVLAWVPERARVATLGAADAPLWTAILAARPHLNAVSDGPADVVLCVEPADPHSAVEAARRLLAPRGHLLLVSTRSPADVIECADGAHVHTQPTVGASILYLILLPSPTSDPPPDVLGAAGRQTFTSLPHTCVQRSDTNPPAA